MKMHPRKTKSIRGVEYGYCGNHCTRGNHCTQQAAEHEASWLANAVLLAPEATDSYSTEQLTKMDMKSVWKPMSSLP